eukprot:TRINITY_DN9141_c0_g1_i1.p4 TRINITY_DN9141_c0_g1~~TRINITY_DN9141_c0_g1_i1.p4  ORF type:complete len:59 (+),score=8.17 TRINITY_DN9141_c0_g1_i1:101-277(+)
MVQLEKCPVCSVAGLRIFDRNTLSSGFRVCIQHFPLYAENSLVSSQPPAKNCPFLSLL